MLDGTTRLKLSDGQPVNQMARIGTFSESVVCAGEMVVPIRNDMRWPQAGSSAAACLPAWAQVMRCAKVESGATVMVIGCGGVGLNVLQGAKLAGAAKIIAVDLIDKKLESAREFGATHLVNSRSSTSSRRCSTRGFAIQILVCERCGGPRRILGAVTEPHAVRRRLAALGLAAETPPGHRVPAA